MRKTMLILALVLAFLSGCATSRPKPYMLRNDDVKEAIKQAVIEMQKQMEESLKRKIILRGDKAVPESLR